VQFYLRLWKAFTRKTQTTHAHRGVNICILASGEEIFQISDREQEQRSNYVKPIYSISTSLELYLLKYTSKIGCAVLQQSKKYRFFDGKQKNSPPPPLPLVFLHIFFVYSTLQT
jgi:hypothetical protein